MPNSPTLNRTNSAPLFEMLPLGSDPVRPIASPPSCGLTPIATAENSTTNGTFVPLVLWDAPPFIRDYCISTGYSGNLFQRILPHHAHNNQDVQLVWPSNPAK